MNQSDISTPPTEDAYRPLQIAFAHYNEHLFLKALGKPVAPVLFTFQRMKGTYGYFYQKRFSDKHGRFVDELAVNPEYFAVTALIETLQTIAHEMAHSWQFEHGKPSRRSYHNRDFARIMHTIGLQVSDTGRPGGTQVGQKMAEYPIAGGEFEVATKALMATGFAIVWYDRFPPKEAQPGMQLGAQVPLEIRSAPELAAALTVPAMDAPKMQLQHSDAGQKNKSNRSKYTCPCGENIWGKPKMRVICGQCLEPFSDTEAGQLEVSEPTAGWLMDDAAALHTGEYSSEISR